MVLWMIKWSTFQCSSHTPIAGNHTSYKFLPVWWCARHLRTASLLIHPLSSSFLLPGKKEKNQDRSWEIMRENVGAEKIMQNPINSFTVLSLGDTNIYSSVFWTVKAWWCKKRMGDWWGKSKRNLSQIYPHIVFIVFSGVVFEMFFYRNAKTHYIKYYWMCAILLFHCSSVAISFFITSQYHCSNYLFIYFFLEWTFFLLNVSDFIFTVILLARDISIYSIYTFFYYQATVFLNILWHRNFLWV